MPNKTISLKKIAILALCVFTINSVSIFVVEEIVFRRRIDIAYYLWRIGHVYIYYWAVYLIISFVYSICFYYVLRLNKIENLRKILRHLYMIAILFGSGMTLYAINKYYWYWYSWSHPNFLEWWGNILFGYLYFLIMQSIIIVFWIILSALVTYFIALDKETRSAAKRSLWQTIKRILRPRMFIMICVVGYILLFLLENFLSWLLN